MQKKLLPFMAAAFVFSFAQNGVAQPQSPNAQRPKNNPAAVQTAQNPQLKTYLDFLYKYLPLPDRTDYSQQFYVHNVELSLRARKEMPWGASIPEREFKHFVLPVRVNNENLDNSREVFYNELKPRVQHLSMYNAVLEVNHWCHEKVTYRPSDARTSSPLATVCTAYGRCGEESTLLVAALRAVGIPARQVYTPRWAHTDDNHAWVEAWVDGKWFFMGACEPEPVLNLGWFNESASRGLLMHTKVFGNYDGPEEVIDRNACYTEINVAENYARTAPVDIVVRLANGQPAAGAQVEFKVYNYAEFYTVATKTADARGRVSLTAGKGDMLVWARQGKATAFKKVRFGTDSRVELTLSQQAFPQNVDLDMVPPPANATLPPVTEAQRALNNRRLAREDSVRKAYEATLPDGARGNFSTIETFLRKAPNPVMAKKLLQVLTPKDLRDVPLEVLLDHAVATTDTTELFCRYVMNPRVENEWLTPYKHFLRKELAHLHNAQQLQQWCEKHLRIDNSRNPQGLRMQPMSVYKQKTTDEMGRKLFFVAAARSLGMPARLNEVTGVLQVYHENGWHTVTFATNNTEKGKQVQSQSGRLRLYYKPSAHNNNPKYYTHFTLSKLENGQWQLLNYPEDATWENTFKGSVELLPGQYVLTTGTRLANGTVLAQMKGFTVKARQTTDLPFTMRENTDAVQVIGGFNAENTYFDLKQQQTKSILSTTGRGYYIVAFVAPNHEPTNHTLRDLGAYKHEFEQWNRTVLCLFADENARKRFNFDEFSMLPDNVVWGIDTAGKCLADLKAQLNLTSDALPVFAVCDSFNRVVYVQQGYTINMGEQLINIIKKINKP